MMRVEFAFHMFGHPYAFGDGTSPVYVVGMLFEKSFVKSLPNFAGPNQGGTSFKLYALNFDLPPSAWPQFVRYLDEYDVQVPLNYNKAPDKNDVPYGSGFPSASNGTWYDPRTGQQVNVIAGTDPDQRSNLDWLPETGSWTRQTTGDVKIKFRRGYPDFSPWIYKDANGNPVTFSPLPLQHGTQVNGKYDFNESDKKLGQWLQANEPSSPFFPFVNSSGATILSKVQDWRRAGDNGNGLTWHHNEDVQTMELVSGKRLNNSFNHDGGGKWAKKARR